MAHEDGVPADIMNKADTTTRIHQLTSDQPPTDATARWRPLPPSFLIHHQTWGKEINKYPFGLKIFRLRQVAHNIVSIRVK